MRGLGRGRWKRRGGERRVAAARAECEEEKRFDRKERRRIDWTLRRQLHPLLEDEISHLSKLAQKKMGALTTVIIVCFGLLAGWAAIEIACKPCLDSGRAALDRSLNPDYDPDDELPAGGTQEGGHYTEAPGKKDEDEEEEKPLTGGASQPVTKDV